MLEKVQNLRLFRTTRQIMARHRHIVWSSGRISQHSIATARPAARFDSGVVVFTHARDFEFPEPTRLRWGRIAGANQRVNLDRACVEARTTPEAKAVTLPWFSDISIGYPRRSY